MKHSVWRDRGVLVVGATSAIAEATMRLLAKQGARLALVGRDGPRLEAIAADLRVRGAGLATTRVMDLIEAEPSQAMLGEIAGALGGFDVVLIAHGVLGDQQQALKDTLQAARIIDANFTSAALWALAATQYLESAGARDGVVATLGSVAGDRGRNANFIYGAAKAGLAVLMQGLAHRAALSGGPRAIVFKLGFVDTPMTAGFKKGGPLWAKPEAVAEVIARGLLGRSAIVYTPWFWRYIILAIRLLPQSVIGRINI